MSVLNVTIREESGATGRKEFVKKYGLKRMKWTARNITKLFRQGTALDTEVDRAMEKCFGLCSGELFTLYGYGDPFDHCEMWGRDRTPLFMIGHPYPYSFKADAMRSLSRICDLGLSVSVTGRSWYHPTALQVEVCRWKTVHEICGGGA